MKDFWIADMRADGIPRRVSDEEIDEICQRWFALIVDHSGNPELVAYARAKLEGRDTA